MTLNTYSQIYDRGFQPGSCLFPGVDSHVYLEVGVGNIVLTGPQDAPGDFWHSCGGPELCFPLPSPQLHIGEVVKMHIFSAAGTDPLLLSSQPPSLDNTLNCRRDNC